MLCESERAELCDERESSVSPFRALTGSAKLSVGFVSVGGWGEDVCLLALNRCDGGRVREEPFRGECTVLCVYLCVAFAAVQLLACARWHSHLRIMYIGCVCVWIDRVR